MSATPAPGACPACRRVFTAPASGRTAIYCSEACRARASQRRAAARGYVNPNQAIAINRDLLARLRTWCAANERTMSTVVARLVEQFLDAQESSS